MYKAIAGSKIGVLGTFWQILVTGFGEITRMAVVQYEKKW